MLESNPKDKTEEPEIDPSPYMEIVKKNTEKLSKKSSKVVVEDDYVEPKDFRAHATRKRDNSLSQSRASQKFNTEKSKGSINPSNNSLKRDLSRSNERQPPMSPAVA